MNSKLFILFSLLISVSCDSERADLLPRQKCEEQLNLFTPACLSSFEFYSLDGKLDTINRMYSDSSKHGHWITYELVKAVPAENESSKVNSKPELMRVKTEEGYYFNNKKVGYWKNFNREGKIVDSIFYGDGTNSSEKH